MTHIQRQLPVSRRITASVEAHCGAKMYQASSASAVARLHLLASKWSLATALALLAWYIFAPQCASTLAVIKRETGGWRYMFITFGYMLALAYAAAFITYHVAVALGWG